MQTFKCGCVWAVEGDALVYRACHEHTLVVEGIGGKSHWLYPPDVSIGAGCGLACCECGRASTPASRVAFKEIDFSAEGFNLVVSRPYCRDCISLPREDPDDLLG